MIPKGLPQIVVDLLHRTEELERKVENRRRKGKVTDVDAAKGLARVQIDTDAKGQPVKTPWIPWKEVAMGAIKTHFPPSVGEQVEIVSENGDLTDAVIDTSIPSNSNQRPHDKAGEGVITVGNTRIQFTGDKVTITSPTIVLDGEIHLGGEGGQLVHRKGDVDSAGDVAVGSASRVYAV